MIYSEFIDLIYAWVYLLLGVITYPGNHQSIVTSASGQIVMAPANSPGSFPHYVSYAGNYPNQEVVSQSGGGAQVVSSIPYDANQVVSTDTSAAGAVQATESVTYSGQEPPPVYQEEQQPVHVVSTDTSAAGSVEATASVTYSGHEPPPGYQEEQQPVHAS